MVNNRHKIFECLIIGMFIIVVLLGTYIYGSDKDDYSESKIIGNYNKTEIQEKRLEKIELLKDEVYSIKAFMKGDYKKVCEGKGNRQILEKIHNKYNNVSIHIESIEKAKFENNKCYIKINKGTLFIYHKHFDINEKRKGFEDIKYQVIDFDKIIPEQKETITDIIINSIEFIEQLKMKKIEKEKNIKQAKKILGE